MHRWEDLQLVCVWRVEVCPVCVFKPYWFRSPPWLRYGWVTIIDLVHIWKCVSWELTLIFMIYLHVSYCLFFLKAPVPLSHLVPVATHMLRCSAEGREYVWVSLLFLHHHRPSLTTFSCSFSRPVVSAVIDTPLAINQRSSRAERRPLSEWTGLAALKKRVREEEFIQLNS